MHKTLWILPVLILLSCKPNKESITKEETVTDTILEKPTKAKPKYKIDFDVTKIANFMVENTEFSSLKALTQKLSDYSTQELEDLPNFIRLTMSIVVPFDISKKNLENTLKSIVHEETEKNNDIDEILIFAYDDKKDIGTGYTFGKLLWAPNAKIGNVTPEIALKNVRTNYRFDIIIKEKVGNIKKEDLPTKRELEIYNEMMDEKYIGMDDDVIRDIVMKKFKIKTEKEYENIYLKVGAYKIF
ncbi:hypothetical protein H0I25_02070 [Cellulophaga sp. HaHa_2_95]|uniref:hypothetical protein n=1 Tax=Cellulophaga sp. HaHa_2_95 TaxID=2745558 RepID=UPI001C4FEEC6|nr:hypothetical protein [Cellulophaga sp. HaHa_2_95]QXP56603.1 hypothetical protein H0I25_02070 [Cellulophaga sp. HaHa_2_95]